MRRLLLVAAALSAGLAWAEGGQVDVADGVGYPAGLTLDASGLPYVPGVRYVLAHHWTGEAPVVSGLPDDWKCVVRTTGDVVVSEVKGLLLILR